MKTLHKHITASFLISFAVTLIVFTFVMCIGIVFKATDLLARRIPIGPIFRILFSGIPTVLAFSMPISILTASLLVFGRLSADNEITAMRVAGISLWKIISRPVLVSFVFCLLCVYINNELAPNSHFARRLLKAEIGMEMPLELLEEGRFTREIAGITVYIGRKKNNRIENVIIYDRRKDGVKREIRAKSGVIKPGDDGRAVTVDLYDVRVDPFSEEHPTAAFCETWSIKIQDTLKDRRHVKKQEDMTFVELIDGIRNVTTLFPDLGTEDLERQKMALRVELNKRLGLSLSCLAFTLLGIPLGIKAHRKESSIGVGISLFLVFCFYLFIIIADSLAMRPAVRPDLIVWLPAVISVSLGLFLIHRAN